MLSNGVKIVLEVSKSDARAEVTMNAFGRVVSVGIDLRSWTTSITKKSYSVRVLVGPLTVSLVHLDKMNSYFNSLLKNKDGQDYTEM